jgi:hypothetical protein|tara:strand:+ start:416 stop:520 length:105 start_codon:yes stop_codon:yes gene_type:complete
MATMYRTDAARIVELKPMYIDRMPLNSPGDRHGG